MRNRYHIGPGAASLVMIVVILCLSVLGILTWSSARADLRLSQRENEMAAGYYRADAQAQRLLAQLDGVLVRCAASAADWQDYLERIDSAMPPEVTREGDALTYTQDAGAQRALRVQMRLAPLGGQTRYQLEAWVLEDQSQWEEEW